MSRSILRRKSSVKPNIKPVVNEKKSSKRSGIEFRWSITASQSPVLEKDSPSNFHRINRTDNQRKPFLPCIQSSKVQDSTPKRLSFSTKKPSFSPPPPPPRLPPINDTNKKNKLSPSPESNNDNNEQISPLLLTYSQLYRAQHPLQMKKTPRKHFSIYSLLNNTQSQLCNVNRNVSISSQFTNPEQLTNDQYIRLRTPQLRRLHISEKNMKDAKKLYFNAACKVFVPHSSIVEIS